MLYHRIASLLGVKKVKISHTSANHDGIGIKDIDDYGKGLRKLCAQSLKCSDRMDIARGREIYNLREPQRLPTSESIIFLQRRASTNRLDTSPHPAIARSLLAWERIMPPLTTDPVSAV
jgi:hypothetical protein